MAPDIFEAYLKQKNFLFKRNSSEPDKTIFVIDSYRIPSGSNSGQTVGIGLPIPADFPDAAPYGIHVRKDHGFKGPIQSVVDSNLGSKWSFWSRKLNWEADRRKPQYYMDQVDRLLGEGS